MKTESGVVANADVKAKDDSEEKEEDPNKIPDNACETLYIQNLNEKVRIPGECARILPVLCRLEVEPCLRRDCTLTP